MIMWLFVMRDLWLNFLKIWDGGILVIFTSLVKFDWKMRFEIFEQIGEFPKY